MPRFSANLSMLYPELDFLERFAAAAADGFAAVEYVGAYDREPQVLRDLLDRHDLTQALFNLPAGNWAAGERGIACLPDRIDAFRESVDTAIRYAEATRCNQVNCLAGIVPPGVDRQAAEQVLVDNLRHAAPRLADAGIKLLLEPINPRDMPGFLVNSTADYERIAAEVGHNNLFLQYDFYHMQVVQGDLLNTFRRLQGRIAHVQVADNPGRHEPGSGEINYAAIFAALDAAGYDGWVGAEYRPRAGTSEGLGWFEPWRRRR
ncbi:2-oxo-tetronate isomerase [Devosia sediminis]|uniref:Hydroxypyruvate isomerase family protein n=1 Tax=Devosia sediminis TaxID=2798801 RepID=A0A934IYG1_9HYPH|nr:2-oxo-tetronate isomerase [Devosia sediminis]MBJ3784520.1 hydroxypyruvate isomerase family protein [Devosia sediminis]